MLPPCCLSGRRQVKDLRGEAATVARSNSGDHLRECYWLVDRRARLLAWARIVAPAAAKAALPSVFLVLAAQYESLTLPLAVILIVPMSLIASITGVLLRGQDNNILTQVGFIVLIGLAGAELRQTLGTAVFSGMIGVTAFGLIFTPAFYVICRWLAALSRKVKTTPVSLSEPPH